MQSNILMYIWTNVVFKKKFKKVDVLHLYGIGKGKMDARKAGIKS